ncbi:uncharacterized protein LAESUDRAFT_720559, partial [Laetiporus sulphureus 93-53]
MNFRLSTQVLAASITRSHTILQFGGLLAVHFGFGKFLFNPVRTHRGATCPTTVTITAETQPRLRVITHIQAPRARLQP